MPRVTVTKLGRHRADGMHFPGKIFIDPRLKPKRKLVVYVHEFLHERHQDWDEEKVTLEGELMGEFLWKQGFRKVEL